MRTLTPTRGELVDAAALTTVTLVAIWAMRSSYGGVAFAVNAGISVLAAIVLVHAARRLAWPAWVTATFAVLVYVLLASLLALRHHGVAGIVPTHTSAFESVTSAATAWKELITTAPPVGATGDLMVLPVFVGFVVAFVASLLATTRSPALAVAPPLIALGLGIAVGTNRPVSLVLHGAVLTVLLFAWLAYREHRSRPLLHALGLDLRALLIGAVVLGGVGAAAMWVGPRLPGADHTPRAIWRQTVTPPFDPRNYPSPLNGYRSYVKLDYDEDDQPLPPGEMFTIEGLPPGYPVRLATMDSYDRMVWQVHSNHETPSLEDSGSFERVGARIAPDVPGEVVDVTVTIHEYEGVWVPDVGEVISIRFEGSTGGAARDRALADSFRYSRGTDAAAVPLRLRDGDRYTMTVRLPHMLETLVGQQIDVGGGARVGRVDPISELTAALAPPDILAIPDTADMLERVKSIMREGAYSDGDLRSSQIATRAGHSAGRLVEFAGDFPATPMIGNAEQYAATYALLFRELGVPTRVVMGFVPDHDERANPDGSVTVVRTDVDAWVEVPVSGFGWVAVFPTPDRDQTTAKAASPVSPEPEYRTEAPPPPPVVDPEFDRPAKADGAEQALQQEPEPDAERAPNDAGDRDRPNSVRDFVSRPVVLITGIAVSPFVLMLLGMVAVVIVKAGRRRRRRRRGAGHLRLANGWREVTDLAIDLGKPVPPTTTRREAAAFVAAGRPDSMSTTLAASADAAIWSGGDISDAEVEEYWELLTRELSAMRRQSGWRARLRSAASWRSLKRGHREGG